jgi:hypothetical protein
LLAHGVSIAWLTSPADHTADNERKTRNGI